MNAKDESYIDHELRIRMLERLYGRLEHKMNVSITLLVGSILAPVLLKWAGFV